jgi:hypothetical protein
LLKGLMRPIAHRKGKGKPRSELIDPSHARNVDEIVEEVRSCYT